MKKIILLLLFALPFNAFGSFDSANYTDSDTANFTSDASTFGYMIIWYGTADDTDPTGNMSCQWDELVYAGISAQVIPPAIGDEAECFYDNNSGQPDGGASTTALAIPTIGDMLDGEYFWVEPDENDACDTTGAQTYNECVLEGNYFATGSFTVNGSEIIGSGFRFFAEDSESYDTTDSQLGASLTTNIEAGVWQTTLLALSIPLAFYIIQKLMFMFGWAYTRREIRKREKEK